MTTRTDPARERWQQLHALFDPGEPATRQAWRVEHPYSPADEILRDLARPFGEPRKRHLLYGTTGAGKSTELLRIAERRAGDSFVVLLDLHRHFVGLGDEAAVQHLHPWEVVFLCGLAVFEAGQQRLGHRWDPAEREALAAAAAFFLAGADADQSPSVDIGKLASAMLVITGGAVGAAAGGPLGAVVGATTIDTLSKGLDAAGELVEASQWTVKLGVRERSFVEDQDTRARDLLAAVNRLIGTLQQHHRPVTVIIDGLDRVREAETVQRLFVESGLIGQLACATVVCGPAALARGGVRRSPFRTHALRSLPVMRRGFVGQPEAEGPGVDRLVEAYRLRAVQVDPGDQLVPQPLLRKLAYYSGGRFRDFVRFVEDLAATCWDDAVAVATATQVDRVLDRWRRVYEEGLDAGSIGLLKQARESGELPESSRALELVENLWLLPYPNDTTWWAPHPLLLMKKLG